MKYTNACDTKQRTDDDFDWSRTNTRTPSSNTGPDADHTVGVTGGAGYYAYIESSSPQITRDYAVLESAGAPYSRGSCLTFW